ncbi:MAG: J domain-containing protein [Pontixanthobacter sp.]
MRGNRFHGRFEDNGQQCQAPGCGEAGEFRAPGRRGNRFDGGLNGPGEWRWFCLDHVRAFNAGYDWFEGMNAEEIFAAQSPAAGWASESRTFRPDAGIGGMPRWADFDDPLDAIGGRAGAIKARAAGRVGDDLRFTPDERAALATMGLDQEIDRQKLRRRYSDLVREFHPDRNGGDRSHEARLGKVVEAYQLLRKAAAFA